jgi:hypothetical protein
MENGCVCDPCINLPIGNKYECSLNSGAQFNLYILVPFVDKYQKPILVKCYFSQKTININQGGKEELINGNAVLVYDETSSQPRDIFTYDKSSGILSTTQKKYLTLIAPKSYDPTVCYIGYPLTQKPELFNRYCMQIIKKGDNRYIGLTENTNPGLTPICSTKPASLCIGGKVVPLHREPALNVIRCPGGSVEQGFQIGFDFVF